MSEEGSRKVEVTPEQAQLVTQMQTQVNAAQGALNALLAGILAGHHIQGRVVRIDGNILTVEVS